jgi:hypothetical protein
VAEKLEAINSSCWRASAARATALGRPAFGFDVGPFVYLGHEKFGPAHAILHFEL